MKRSSSLKKTMLFITAISILMMCCLVGCSTSSNTQAEQFAWSFNSKGMIHSSPIIYENMILFGSDDKNFYAVDLETQKQVWTVQTASGVNSKAIIQGETVFFVGGDICYAVEAKTGKEKWKYDAQVQNKSRKDWDYHDASLAMYKDILLFSTGDGRILGLNQQDGSVKWQFATGKNEPIRTTPFIHEAVMFFGDWGGNFYAVNLESQVVKWTVNVGVNPIQASPYVHNNTVYFGGRDTMIHALDIHDGKEKWTYRDPEQSWFTGDIFVERDILYVGGSDNHQVLALDANNGNVIRKYYTSKNVFSKPAIDGHILYVCDGDAYSSPGAGNIYAFDLQNGEKALWKVSIKGNIFSSPVIHNNRIYFGSSDGKIYVVKKEAK